MKNLLGTILILLILSTGSFSQKIGFHGIAPKISYIVPWDDAIGKGFGIGAIVDLGELAPGIYLRPLFAYEKPGSADDDFGSDITNIQLGADVAFFMYPDFYVGAGVSINFFSYGSDFDELFGNPGYNSTDPGFSLIAGYWRDLGNNVYLGSEFRGDVISEYNHAEWAIIVMIPIGKK